MQYDIYTILLSRTIYYPSPNYSPTSVFRMFIYCKQILTIYICCPRYVRYLAHPVFQSFWIFWSSGATLKFQFEIFLLSTFFKYFCASPMLNLAIRRIFKRKKSSVIKNNYVRYITKHSCFQFYIKHIGLKVFVWYVGIRNIICKNQNDY